MRDYRKFFELTKDDDVNLEELIRGLINDCGTPQEMIDRWNDYTKTISGIEQFSWVTHNNKKVLFGDVSQGNIEDWGSRSVVAGNYFLAELFRKFPSSIELLVVLNMEKIGFSSELRGAAYDLRKVQSKFTKHKTALYGIPTSQKIFLKVFSMDKNMRIVNTKEEALDWVTR